METTETTEPTNPRQTSTGVQAIRRWMKRNEFKSLRQAAAQLGISFPHLGDILAGRKRITDKTARTIAANMRIKVWSRLCNL